jgi:microcompartment protein CcmK/EutM
MDPEVAKAAKVAVDYVQAGFGEQGTFGPKARAKYEEIIDAKGEDHRSEQVAVLMAGLNVVVEALIVVVRDGTGLTPEEIFAKLKRTFDNASG